jgi:SAM-dependent methyltransferase
MQPYLTGHPRLPGTPHSAPSPEDESKQRLPEIGSAFLDSHPLDYYTSVRYDVVSMIPPGVQSILEVGCGAGQTGALLRKLGVSRLIGVEINPRLRPFAQPHYSQLITGDVEDLDLSEISPQSIDCILYPDVLEHLRDPWRVVQRHTRVLRPGGVVVASIPNVRYYKAVRDLVLRGRWDYQDAGILDKGHLRFFTRSSIEQLFLTNGLCILKMEANLRGPDVLRFVNKLVLNRLLPFLAKQYLVVAQKPVSTSSESLTRSVGTSMSRPRTSP